MKNMNEKSLTLVGNLSFMEDSIFFTIQAKDVSPLCLVCVTMTDSMMKDDRWKSTTLLQGNLLEGFYRLKEQLDKLRNSEGEEIELKDIPLDVFMGIALMHAIIQPFYKMKGHILLPESEKDKISAESEEEIQSVYYGLKEAAADLLTRLTKASNYMDYGLQTLEEVFDLKIAERPIKADNIKELTHITPNDFNMKAFRWMFTMFDTLELYQEEYEFARRFYACEFIHISDFKSLKEKLVPEKIKKKIPLTLRDTIVLYCMLNLAGRLYLSDAVQYFEDVAEQLDAQRTVNTTTTQVRDVFLKFCDDFRDLIKTKLATNEAFNHEIERTNHWEI